MSSQAKTFTGIVASNKADKTIAVSVVTRKTHPLYKKQYTYSKKFLAHDEKNEAGEGDKVVIAETRPISARKRFVLKEIVSRAPVRHVEDESPAEELMQKSKPEEKTAAKADKQPKADKKDAKEKAS